MRSKKKKLGCCGYDELAYKPPTTRPLNAADLVTKKLKGHRNLGSGQPTYRVSNLG